MPKDCIILVADLDTENAIKGLLTRPLALGCRTISFDIFRHPRRDPGVRLESAAFFRPFLMTYDRAVAILDRHGSGAEQDTAEVIERNIEGALHDWRGNAIAVVIDPELEAWVWSDSPEVDRSLGWYARAPGLRQWLIQETLLDSIGAKPRDPKAAYERALRHAGKTRSASIFEAIGKSVSTRRCSDRAFCKLRDSLNSWFPGAPG